jgi:hypothetical protein
MADGVTAIKVGARGPRQFQALFSEAIPFNVTFEDDSILDGDEYVNDVTVPGAQLGDFVFVAPELDTADLAWYAAVTAANTVTIQLSNMTGGTLTTFATGAKLNGLVLRLSDDLFADASAA